MIQRGNPVISIILPTYNGGKYLARSIESCLSQTFTGFELIIVNDCSTDSTAMIAEEFASRDDRIVLINNSSNLKLPASLNVGFNRARGDYFTWTSDDNIYKKNALEMMLAEFGEHKPVDIVYADYTIIGPDGKEVQRRKLADWRNLYRGNCIGACFLYKKQVHEILHGYDESLFLIEDYDFWIRASNHFQFKKLNESLYYYQLHSNSLTEVYQEKIRISHQLMMLTNFDDLKWLTRHERISLAEQILGFFKLEKNREAFFKMLNEKLNQSSKDQVTDRLIELSIWMLDQKDKKISEILSSKSYLTGNKIIKGLSKLKRKRDND